MAKNEYFKLFLDADDMTKLYSCSKSKSYERLKKISRHNKLQPHQRVNIFHFCAYEGIPVEDMIVMMKEAGIIPNK